MTTVHQLNQWLSLNVPTIEAAKDTVRVIALVDGTECVTFTLGGVDMQGQDEDPMLLAAALQDLADTVIERTVDLREAQVYAEQAVGA
jgi:hypothetical protein